MQKLNIQPCCDYANGGLRSVDIFCKIVTLECSLVR